METFAPRTYYVSHSTRDAQRNVIWRRSLPKDQPLQYRVGFARLLPAAAVAAGLGAAVSATTAAEPPSLGNVAAPGMTISTDTQTCALGEVGTIGGIVTVNLLQRRRHI